MRAENATTGRNSLTLLTALMRSLGHRLRTPLSVISNELSCLSRIVPEGECSRAQRQCQEISTILKSTMSLAGKESPARNISGAELFSQLTCLEAELSPEQAVLKFCLDPEMIQAAVVMLRERIIDGEEWQASFEFDRAENLFSLWLENRSAAKDSPALGRQFSLISEFLLFEYDRDSIEAPVCDALFLAQGIDVQITADASGAAIKLGFPVAGEECR
jgi:hypothetical protein